MKTFDDPAQLLDVIAAELNDASKVISDLHDRGYNDAFVLMASTLVCQRTGVPYRPRELRVDEIYRFDDNTGVLCRVYLYAVRSEADAAAGIFLIAVDKRVGQQLRDFFSDVKNLDL